MSNDKEKEAGEPQFPGEQEPEDQQKGCAVCKPDYPRRVFFILGMEFCERFCFYGMKAVLQTYLMVKLGQDADTAASLYHAFAIVTYFTPLPGAILADSFIGRYWTIFSLSIIYVIGNIIMASTAIGPGYIEGALVGMFTIAIGTGGIKPCVSAFGADQFSAKQSGMQKAFFSLFYIAVNSGALLSQFITPLVKGQSCFGEEECWVLAFGLPAALMVVAWCLFLFGTPFYKRAPVTENVPFQMAEAIIVAAGRSCGKRRQKANHWLDRAMPEFSQQFVDDVKAVLRVLALFLPLPFFWALFDQQGSRWTYQAQKMNTYIDIFDIHLEAEQIQIANGLFVVIFVGIFDAVVYPIFAKCNLCIKALPRMIAGCALAAMSFVVIGVIQLGVQSSNDLLDAREPGTFRTRAYNTNPDCAYDLYVNDKNITHMNPYDQFKLETGSVQDGDVIQFKNVMCQNGRVCASSTQTPAKINPLQPISSVFFDDNCKATFTTGNNSFPLTPKGSPAEILYQILIAPYTPLPSSKINRLIVVRNEGDGVDEKGIAFFFPGAVANQAVQLNYTTSRVPSHFYKLKIVFENGTAAYVGDFQLLQGGAYTIYVTEVNGQYAVRVLQDKGPNAVSVYWQLIPYLILTFGEIPFSITGLSFAFSQAPASMKSVLIAGWYLTSAFGNIIDLIVIEIQIPDKAIEFFLFAGLMVVVTIIFGIMAHFYKYVEDIEAEKKAANATNYHSPPPHPQAMLTVPSVPMFMEPPSEEKPMYSMPPPGYNSVSMPMPMPMPMPTPGAPYQGEAEMTHEF